MRQTFLHVGSSRARGVLVPVVALGLASTALMPVSSAGQGGSGDGAAEARTLGELPSGGEAAQQVTLITGDVVHWQPGVEGNGAAFIEDNGVESIFHTIESDEGYYVIPSDVEPLVDTFLDRELFNVSSLVEQGYTDDKVNGVPVILQRADDAPAAGAHTPGLDVKLELSSINAVAGNLDRDASEEIGTALALTAEQSYGARDGDVAPASSLAGVEKIWLDGQASVSLEESVPRTGAPAAWEAGYDGTGMLIAVLDTGIDPNHPDVADKIAITENFTEDDSIQDGYGHGTHVASIAAGTGAASDGLRKGVAPGADLAIGKVMNSDGKGATSWIIAGMEWAAALEGVDVINMSLGGGFSDGTDPMSQALNELTEEYGVLFVTSAGNEGPGVSTLTYPATADAALAVGSVNKDGDLSYSSSRGPRLGDFAIKPEITAPGVSIKAARAAGTSMGSPLDDYYTSTSGTSMAAPHVAGAVALLKQEHPDWTPQMLKAALVNSATPHEDANVFQQGGGELDLATAIEASVVTTPAALSMGLFRYPHEGAEPVTKTLTYTNLGDAAAMLDVQLNVTDEDGAPAPEGMVTVEPTTVDLAPGASAEVHVTLDRTLGENQTYSGSIEAIDADGNRVTGTPFGFVKKPEVYDITVQGIQRNGKPAAKDSSVAITDAVTMSNFGKSRVEYIDGTATVEVPPGTYSVMTMISMYDGEEGSMPDSQALMGNPEVEVTEDVHLTFDARDAVEVTVDTPYEDAEIEGHSIEFNRRSEESGSAIQSWVGGDFPYYIAPTEPVTLGEFNFGTKFDLSAPGAYLDLAFPEPGAIPAEASYEVDESNTASIETAYYSDSAGQPYARAVPARFPWESKALGEYRYLEAPMERTEIFSANSARYYQAVTANEPYGQPYYETERGYEPGEQLEQSWASGPRTPALREGNAYTASAFPTTRLADTLELAIFEFGDSSPGAAVHTGARDPFGANTAEFRLYQDGELYATSKRAFGTVPVDPASRLRIELDVTRDEDWWTTSTATRTAWEFDSSTTETAEALPLLQVDYDVPLDLNNTALPASELTDPFRIGVDVRMPYDVADTEVTDVQFWMSYDDGATWTEVAAESTGENSYEVEPAPHEDAGAASLKIEATDVDGNKIEQEVIRAYNVLPSEGSQGPESVERLSGVDRFATAAAAATDVYPEGADVVYVATGRSHPDALAATAPAGHEDGPVLLTEAATLPQTTRAALEALDPAQIIVTGGPNSVSEQVLTQLSEYTDGEVTRISGADRYETAAALSDRFAAPETVFVATGQDYPDALAAGARAGMAGAPVLLVRQDAIPDSTADALTGLTPGNIVVVGGENSVSAKVLAGLGEYTDGEVTRVSGADRYETAAALSAGLESSEFGFIASGEVWPDALSAAALAGHLDSPVLLVSKDELPQVTETELERLEPAHIRVVGGENTVAQAVVTALKALVYTND